MITTPIVELLQQQHERALEVVRATAERGTELERILGNEAIRAFFTAEALRLYKAFLDAPDAELVARRNEARQLNALYESLVGAVAAGRVAVQRLAQVQAKQEEASK